MEEMFFVSIGWAAAWIYFEAMGLIRSREEYYYNRWIKHKKIPENWRIKFETFRDFKKWGG